MNPLIIIGVLLLLAMAGGKRKASVLPGDLVQKKKTPTTPTTPATTTTEESCSWFVIREGGEPSDPVTIGTSVELTVEQAIGIAKAYATTIDVLGEHPGRWTLYSSCGSGDEETMTQIKIVRTVAPK